MSLLALQFTMCPIRDPLDTVLHQITAIDILATYKVCIPSQVIIEGIWGNNRASGFLAVDDVTFYDGVSTVATSLLCNCEILQVCSTIPEPALIIKGECTFDRDACGWRNTTTVSPHHILICSP